MPGKSADSTVMQTSRSLCTCVGTKAFSQLAIDTQHHLASVRPRSSSDISCELYSSKLPAHTRLPRRLITMQPGCPHQAICISTRRPAAMMLLETHRTAHIFQRPRD